MFYLDKYYDYIVEESFQDKLEMNYFPNMIIYGVNSFGKQYYLNHYLENFYDKENIKTEDVEYEIEGYGNSKTEITLEQSMYHLIFRPNSNGFDKYVLQKIINDFCQSPLVSMIDNKITYRTIVIDSIDDLNYYAQASLRRTMEKYVKICRFILISENLSKVSETIRSRCCLIRVPLNTLETNQKIIKHIGNEEKIDKKIINQVLKDDNLDIKQLLWKLFVLNLDLPKRLELKDYLSDLMVHVDKLSKKFTFNELVRLRQKIHLIYISNFSIEKILQELLNKFLEKDYSIEKKYQISKTFMEYNYRVNNGKRSMIHLESLIFAIISL